MSNSIIDFAAARQARDAGRLQAGNTQAAPTDDDESGYREPPRGAGHSEQEIEAFRNVLLGLQLPEVGLTAEQALVEAAAIADDFDDAKVARFLVLKSALEDVGLRFCSAREEQEIPRGAFLWFTWPVKLLLKHPDLKGLKPADYEGISLG